MAWKDIQKADKSIFAVVIILTVLLGVVLLMYMIDKDDTTVPAPQQIGNASIVTGIIDELVEDCVRSERLVDGELEFDEAIICDGGSSVVVGDQRIQTSAGFVAQSEYFEVDISDLSVGDSVEVIFNERSPGIYDLDCDECAIRAL